MPYSVGEHVQAVQACNVCHSHARRIVALQGRKGQALTTAICTSCGLVQSEPIPSPEELREYYRNAYRRDYKGTHRPKRKHILRYSRNAMTRLERLRPFSPGKKWLDVGSGSGEFVYMACKAGFDAVGLEPHEAYSAYTRETFGVPVITAAFQEASIEPKSLDVVTLHHVLEHIADPYAALATIHGWLKPGGLLAVDVPDIDHVPRSFINHFHYAHIYNFGHATLRALLEKCGYTLEAACGREGTSLVARKTHAPDPQATIVMPEVYHAFWQKMATQDTGVKRRKRSVQRLLRRCVRYPVEYIQALSLGQPRQIADHVWRTQ